jgi:hypothetical protein
MINFTKEGTILVVGRCWWCGRTYHQDRWDRGPDEDDCQDDLCPECQAAEDEAERRSLEAAESGAGLEALYDWQYHMQYGDEL